MFFTRAIHALCLLLFILALNGCSPVITDSDLTKVQAIYKNQPPDVSREVQDDLTVVDVRYYGFDERLHAGQVVIHHALADDIRTVFSVIEAERFPIASVLPVAHPEIQRKGPYGLSPDTNNTSGYAWRPVVRSTQLSMHALGQAIDINPRLNPYRRGNVVLPPGAIYNPPEPGTLVSGSAIVNAFKKLGWEWGGDWSGEVIDFMHFEKNPTARKSLTH